MSESTLPAVDRPVPTFFGRFTAVLSEHEHLETTLRKLGQMTTALGVGQDVAVELEPGRLLTALQADLVRHFAAEEASGYFGVVARDFPVLLPRIVELKLDHAEMLETIHTLLLAAADEARRFEVAASVAALITRLRAHEQMENELLHEYFRSEVASGET
jgi:hypothetical protein